MKKAIKQANGRKRRLSSRQKDLLISWVCFLIIGALLGYGICALTKAGQAPKKEQTSETERDTEALPPYGTRDGRTLESEISMDWDGDLEFTPIDCALPENLQEFTYYLSQGYYIDFSFVMGLMYRESSFRTDCVSGTDDYGIMQINAKNHKWLSEQLGLDDIADPYQNIRAGLFILRKLFEKYDDPARVLMAYNMGEYGASVLWERGVYETMFTRRVLETANKYKAEIENKK